MNEKYVDGILAYVDGMMTPEYRDVLVAELKDIDESIQQYIREIKKWSVYARRAETEADVPEDLRSETLETLGRKKKLLRSAERYRAYIVHELYNQPQYTSGFVLNH